MYACFRDGWIVERSVAPDKVSFSQMKNIAVDKMLFFFCFFQTKSIDRIFISPCSDLIIPIFGLSSMQTYVVDTHEKRLAKALLMSTHNICFRRELITRQPLAKTYVRVQIFFSPQMVCCGYPLETSRQARVL